MAILAHGLDRGAGLKGACHELDTVPCCELFAVLQPVQQLITAEEDSIGPGGPPPFKSPHHEDATILVAGSFDNSIKLLQGIQPSMRVLF
jgi:hypothetical protein